MSSSSSAGTRSAWTGPTPRRISYAPLGGRARGQPGHRALEDVAVVLVDAERLARPLLRLEVAPDAERAVGVDAPRQRDPELVLLPHLARARAARIGDRGPEPLAGGAHDRLAEPDPLRVVGLVRVEIVALAAVPRRQHVVGVLGRLAPGRGQRDVQPDLLGIAQHLDPGEPVGVGPHRVVDPREVDLERAAAVGEELRQEERQLVHRERVLDRPRQLVPGVRVRRWGTCRPRTPPRRAAR